MWLARARDHDGARLTPLRRHIGGHPNVNRDIEQGGEIVFRDSFNDQRVETESRTVLGR